MEVSMIRLRALAACVALALSLAGLRADGPHRINRAIELLADGQPIYYTGSHEGTDGNFEPGAVRAFVEAVRFPAFGGRRGVHGNPTAARIWGISADEYADKADAWPLNPKGELLLGLKLEDKYALENAETNSKVPGVAFAEWGPGDMAFSLGVKSGPGPMPALMQAARAKVFAATKAQKIFFLNSVNADNVV